MSIIGEALLSATIDALFDKLASTDLLQFARQEQVHADLKKWEKILRKIYKVLDDAEERQITDRFVKDWLHELKNLTYDVEDMLDEFVTESLRRKLLDEDEPQGSPSKLSKLIPVCCSSLNPRSLKFNVKMASEIKGINDRFEKIVEQKNNLDLKDNLGGKSYKVRYQRIPATSLNDPHVYGRDREKEAILDMLMKGEGGSVGVPVISIVGMGGLGKTTLAQLVYNDVKVKSHFDIKAWACISEDFDIASVTKAVLQSIAPETGDVNDLNMLQVKLREKLEGKKFFIVLDDVWNENYEEWTILCRPFEACSSGSKIVITTRNHSVASMVGTHSAYQLKELSNDNCLSIFTYHSLGKMDFSEHQDLKRIGEKIVKRCKGLPLAVKTLGGLLRGKVRSKDWKDVLNCKIWTLPEEKSSIIPALRVSYYYLPSYLKRCFAYSSLFSKDYIFEMNKMILLWMAEGFLQSSEKEAEDTGEDFFEELYSRSFFQQYSSDSSSFVMHDLIHDLAQWAAEDFCFRVDNSLEGDKQSKIPKYVRHVSYINDGFNYENREKFEEFNEIKSIRTLLVNHLRPDSVCDLLNLLPRLQHLRVLSLKSYSITKLPNTIGDLKHFRYLHLSDTDIKNLPDAINKLYNLETLILDGNHPYLTTLCSDIGNLINLRHLYISNQLLEESMPSGIGRLNNLRTLSVYVVRNDNNLRLKELKNLTHLRGKLCISGLIDVTDVEDAKAANCNGKENLRELELKWTSSVGCKRNFDIETQVLDMLQPHQNLEKLTIVEYGGTKFPSWLGITSFSSLVNLRFEYCWNCTSMPPLGQLLLLKDLFIRGLRGIRSIGLEFYGNGCSTPFQSLETLCVEDMEEWKDWSLLRCGEDIVGFPHLQRLYLNNCPNLTSIQDSTLPSELKFIEIQKCNALESLPKSWMGVVEGLGIEDCDSLTYIARDHLPPNLKKLEIYRCSSLKILVDEEEVSQTCEDDINSGSCKKLESIAESFHGNTSLETLSIVDCESLETLPSGMNNLISLQRMTIDNCPGIVSFSEDGFPTNITSLVIKSCKSSFEWGLRRLTCLKELRITGGCEDVMSFPEEEKGLMLPTSLTTLHINKFPNLERLSSSFQELTSLKVLVLYGCPNLKFFPKKGLPPSLLELEIWFCPLLEQSCNNEGLAFIPSVTINGREVICRRR